MSSAEETLGRSLEAALGPDKVRTDEGSRHIYSTDASPCAVEPRAVAFAASEADVLAVLQVCRDLQVPLTPRASGTSLSGAAIGPGVVLDRKSTRLNSSHLVISYAVFCLKKKKISIYFLTNMIRKKLIYLKVFTNHTASHHRPQTNHNIKTDYKYNLEQLY